MSTSQISRISLSTDEMALVYSLLNMPTSGKALLYEAYGNIPAPKIEEKLVTASHSLMARDLVKISEKGTVVLNEVLENFFIPLIQFTNMVQIIVNIHEKKDIITATDYYLGKNGFFTSHEIDMGVVHRLFHGEVSALAEFILGRMTFPEDIAKDIKSALAQNKPVLKMSNYPQLEGMGMEKAAVTLTSYGIDPLISQALSKDICSPVRRGSFVMAGVTSETLKKKDFSKTGTGFFWLTGEKSSWIMAFDRGDQETTAVILPGITKEAEKLLQIMLA